MARYIDFEIAREYLHKACECLGGNGGMMLKIKFDEEPTADVRKVVHGEWVNHSTKSENSGQTYYSFRCSVCGDNHGVMWDFCPNCGADMRGGHNERE